MDYWINDPTCQSDVQFVLKMIFIIVPTRSSSLELQALLVTCKKQCAQCVCSSCVCWQGRDGWYSTATLGTCPLPPHWTSEQSTAALSLGASFLGHCQIPSFAPSHVKSNHVTLQSESKVFLKEREHYTTFTWNTKSILYAALIFMHTVVDLYVCIKQVLVSYKYLYLYSISTIN